MVAGYLTSIAIDLPKVGCKEIPFGNASEEAITGDSHLLCARYFGHLKLLFQF